MSPVEKVFFDCPDGVARELRATLGARKRISELTGKSMALLITEQDGGAFPVILWAMMHDAEGNPPDISIKWLEENVPMEDAVKAYAAILSAISQGKQKKTELEALLNLGMKVQTLIKSGRQEEADELMKTWTGSQSGLSALKRLESQTEISGTDT